MTGNKMKRSQDLFSLSTPLFFLPQAEKMERRLNKKVFLKFMQLKQQQQQEQKQQQQRQQQQLLLLPLLKQQQHVPMVFDE